MKGKSSQMLTALIVLLLVISVIGSGVMVYSIMGKGSPEQKGDKDSGTVNLDIPPEPSTNTGKVKLTVE